MKKISESDFQLAKLVLSMCNDPKEGSQTRKNPYSIPAIVDALKYLAGQYDLMNWLDAAEWVVEEYLIERKGVSNG